MRIAVVHHDRCHPLKCGTECILYCPRVRTGDETIVIGDDRRIVISEELCVGCGICVKKCPFEALDIINLPEELDQPTHRYGRNGFVLYGLPIPVEGRSPASSDRTASEEHGGQDTLRDDRPEPRGD